MLHTARYSSIGFFNPSPNQLVTKHQTKPNTESPNTESTAQLQLQLALEDLLGEQLREGDPAAVELRQSVVVGPAGLLPCSWLGVEQLADISLELRDLLLVAHLVQEVVALLLQPVVVLARNIQVGRVAAESVAAVVAQGGAVSSLALCQGHEVCQAGDAVACKHVWPLDADVRPGPAARL